MGRYEQFLLLLGTHWPSYNTLAVLSSHDWVLFVSKFIFIFTVDINSHLLDASRWTFSKFLPLSFVPFQTFRGHSQITLFTLNVIMTQTLES